MNRRPRVVIVRSGGAVPSEALNPQMLERMFALGFSRLGESVTSQSALHNLFGGHEKIGVKINTIGGKQLSTRPPVSLALAGVLREGGLREENIIIWDRTNRELRNAGYRLNMNRFGFKIYGTDTSGVGYQSGLTLHLNIGSRFSTIQTHQITASISLALLKDHGLAGVTAGLKNYFGAIHNPNKYHDNHCDPFAAEVFDCDPVKRKHRLTILDALSVQYHRGPAFHPSWNQSYGCLIFSLDPVAADFIGWQILEKLRARKGLPSLHEENREPLYIRTAERMGLGVADRSAIEVIEDEI